MKKSICLIGLLIMSLAFIGCDKKKGSGNGQVYAYAPNNCFGGGYGGYPNNYNQFNQFNNGYQYYQRYQWSNGQCVDVQDGGAVNQTLCQGATYNNNSNCTYYGYNNGVYNGHVSGAYNACSMYNTPYEQFYPVYYPNLRTTVCAGYSAYSTFSSYYPGYSPMYYGGYNNVYQGCMMGGSYNYGSRCKCKSVGGTLGWIAAGVTMGVCYY